MLNRLKFITEDCYLKKLINEGLDKFPIKVIAFKIWLALAFICMPAPKDPIEVTDRLAYNADPAIYVDFAVVY